MIYHVSPQGWPYCKYTERKQIASSISKNITLYHLLFSSRDNAYKLDGFKPLQKGFIVYLGWEYFFDIGQIKD